MAKKRIKSKTVEINPDLLNDNTVNYIMTEHVLMNSEGTFIQGKYGFYKISSFAFLIKHLVRDSKDNVFRIIEIPIENGNNDE